MVKDVSIEIIQKCVNRCIHCSSCSTEACTTILRLDTLKHVIAGLNKLEVERICLSGGEPFLHPDIVDIVQEISDYHIITDIYTCGIIKLEGKAQALSVDMLSQVKNAGVRTLIFNLPSHKEETYDLITQSKGHFPLLCESIANAGKCGIQTEIHFVPMKQNVADAVGVIQLAEEMGVAQVNFLKLVPHGRARDNQQDIMLDDADLEELCFRLENLKMQGEHIRLGLPLSARGSTPPCHAVREKLYIKFDGSVFGCEAFKYITYYNDLGERILPENVLDKDIVEIYHGSEFLKRSAELVENYENCQVGCENCPVQKYLKMTEDVK